MSPHSFTERLACKSIAQMARRAFAVGLTLLVLTGCGSSDSDVQTEALAKNSQADVRNKLPPMRNADLHEAARHAAWMWLDQLEIDPVALMARGVKGKKKLAEAIGAYMYLFRYSADPIERSQISRRLDELEAHTARPEYHNMQDCEDREFNQNSMSYLRVAWLLEQLERDTTHYRSQIELVRPRLERSLSHRTSMARSQFEWYYEYFEWTLPKTQKPKTEQSTVAKRTPTKALRKGTTYLLTHEVSVAFRFGLRKTSDAFDEDDRAYLRRVLPALTIRFSQKRLANPDVVAELVSAMTYLGFENIPAYHTGVQFLLRTQNANGSWGNFEGQRSSLGSDVDTKHYLHTTMVVSRALLESDNRAWRKTFTR